ncbi:hypothetical protein COCMIDRAFT_22662 [Bipolaris oryzae ATCC 44560]|uniref:Uncharacterized protein n=1 Tax=Bipolaris oryzae ATCC 44560 TaxID=930090 RepID=W7A0V8_COCMI|nr:uncharacterized protein COCMIDRAFT_22662 [Bipolaris oryzae ATCC 44560]EUC49676.1 hypothetical protein COCMIDRAFT_22662 [Bipolaris oryzae ATCC 44560]
MARALELSWTLEISHLGRLARTSRYARWLRYQADPSSMSSSAQLCRGLHPWTASWRGPARPARPMGMERMRERVEYAMRTTVISYMEKAEIHFALLRAHRSVDRAATLACGSWGLD